MVPKVTIVLPNYNGADFLGQAIKSLLGQTYHRFRMILVDNRSTDASVCIASSFRDPRLEIKPCDTHVPMVANWNRAVALVDSPFFVLAHSDCLYHRRYLERMVPLLEAHPRAFIAHCRVSPIDEHGRVYWAPQEAYKDCFWPPHERYERDVRQEFACLRRRNYILMPSVLYRTDTIRAVGPFNQRYRFVPDWEFWLRGLLAGYTIVGTREKLTCYRRHPCSMTSMLERGLVRYQEERALADWATGTGVAARLLRSHRVDHTLVRNSILSEFARRLSRADRAGAGRLLAHARADLPRFSGSFRDYLMSLAMRWGRPAGALLQAAEQCYLRWFLPAALSLRDRSPSREGH